MDRETHPHLDPLYDNPSQIRAVNMLLAGRPNILYRNGIPQFFRNNLSTQVSIRSLSFSNQFNTIVNGSVTAP